MKCRHLNIYTLVQCCTLKIQWTSRLDVAGVPVDVVDDFVRLGSWVSSGGVTREIPSGVVEARGAHVNLSHSLFSLSTVTLSIKYSVYNASVRTV